MKCDTCEYLKKCDHQCRSLPEGKTCEDCIYITWCVLAYGVKRTDTKCDFSPVRFVEGRGREHIEK